MAVIINYNCIRRRKVTTTDNDDGNNSNNVAPNICGSAGRWDKCSEMTC